MGTRGRHLHAVSGLVRLDAKSAYQIRLQRVDGAIGAETGRAFSWLAGHENMGIC